MRRNPNPASSAANATRFFDSQVVLSPVHAARAGKQRDVRTVIYDEAHAALRQFAGKPSGNFKQLTGRSILIAVLNQLDPGVRQRFGQNRLGYGEQAGIEYGIEAWKD